MKILFSFILTTLLLNSYAQTPHRHITDRAIDFPNVPGYITLKADLHMHSVFSDGEVWPSIRVQEAQRDSLDVISLTEHLEYQPHKQDIPHPDRNRAHDLALKSAEGSDLIVIRGSEITRSMPPGHSNAIFIKDANKLIMDDSVAVFKEAHDQGAFIFWNHPNWIAQYTNGVAKLTKMHENLIKQGYLNGIEVVNELTYSEEALQIALDNNLTIIGTSDVHGLIDWLYDVPEGGHRPVTLVFAKERTEAALKEALFARRTAVWFNNTLIGREEMLTPLIKSSISILEDAAYLKTWRGDTEVLKVEIMNSSDASFLLYNKSDYNFHTNDDVIMLEPHSVTSLEVKTITVQKNIELKFTILNAVTAPNTHPEMVWQVKVKEKERE